RPGEQHDLQDDRQNEKAPPVGVAQEGLQLLADQGAQPEPEHQSSLRGVRSATAPMKMAAISVRAIRFQTNSRPATSVRNRVCRIVTKYRAGNSRVTAWTTCGMLAIS